MSTWIFASSNAHKVDEVRQILPPTIELVGLKEVGITGDLEETSGTLEGNARQKAWFVYRHAGKNCFADDTGLEISALNGAPGVFSARYAGEGRDMAANRKKVLEELRNLEDRSARFRTVICAIEDGKEYIFEGIITGVISPSERGSGGFGYDALFIPEGGHRTFAEMNPGEKNAVSHRARALEAFRRHLTRS